MRPTSFSPTDLHAFSYTSEVRLLLDAEGTNVRCMHDGSPTSKSDFILTQHSQEDNNKTRFCSKTNTAGLKVRNTLKSGYPNN
jgi:hypothetical protein